MLSEKREKRYIRRTNKKKKVKEKLDYQEKLNDYIKEKGRNGGNNEYGIYS